MGTTWTPRSRGELDAELAEALADHDDEVRAWWAGVRIEPARWRCSPWGDRGGGFWAVAIERDQVLWYNDIEDGFNWSPFVEHGTIGDYRCNQDDFALVLDRMAHALGEAAQARLDPGGVPAALAGPGSIVRRQTTYWELRAAAGGLWRVHVRDKRETWFDPSPYPRAEVVTQHPLLVQYQEPSRALYFTGQAIDPRRLTEQLERVVQDASDGWRRLADHARHVDDVERLLRGGHGLLMQAPASLCTAMAAALQRAGIRTSILGDSRTGASVSALMLGRSYVIARSFAFEAKEPAL